MPVDRDGGHPPAVKVGQISADGKGVYSFRRDRQSGPVREESVEVGKVRCVGAECVAGGAPLRPKMVFKKGSGPA